MKLEGLENPDKNFEMIVSGAIDKTINDISSDRSAFKNHAMMSNMDYIHMEYILQESEDFKKDREAQDDQIFERITEIVSFQKPELTPEEKSEVIDRIYDKWCEFREHSYNPFIERFYKQLAYSCG